MSLLPPTANHRSRGSLASVWFLGLFGPLEFGTGCVHDRLPDGGAGVIAGLDLTENTHVIVDVFAWMKYLTSQRVFFSESFSFDEAHTAPGSPELLRPAGP